MSNQTNYSFLIFLHMHTLYCTRLYTFVTGVSNALSTFTLKIYSLDVFFAFVLTSLNNTIIPVIITMKRSTKSRETHDNIN